MKFSVLCRAAALILGGASLAHSGNDASACNLLSRADIEQALGVSVVDGRAQVNSDVVSVCSFEAHGGGRISVLLRRHVRRDWTAEQARRMTMSYRPLDGLGDRAFGFEMGNAGAALCIFERDYYLQISVFQAGDAVRAHRGVERLARTALTRLEAAPD